MNEKIIVDKKDAFIAYLLHKIYGKKTVPQYIKKLSKKKYGLRNDLVRFYIKKYFGLYIGKYTTYYDSILCDASMIGSIGKFCSIAKNVHFTEGNHPLSCVSTSAMLYNQDFGFVKHGGINTLLALEERNLPSRIGNDVWIGRDVTILPSVTIGDGAVIGTGAIVNKDIPPYAIAVGVPAKVIKYRFSKDDIDKLLNIKWWDWSDDLIKENIDLFKCPRKFIDYMLLKSKL